MLLFIDHSFILYTAELGASDDDDDDDIDLENSCAGSQTATQCPTVSTDSDPTVAGLDLSS